MDELKNPWLRDDGLPWVAWESTPALYGSVAECRERVELTAWYDRHQQRLVVTLTRYDESMAEYTPCWAQVAHVDCGPFLAGQELAQIVEVAIEQVRDMCGLGLNPG